MTGMRDVGHLVSCVQDCGFDEDVYLNHNPGLRQAGFDSNQALFHFLEYGFNEDRDNVCGRLPDGLHALTALAIPDRTYASRLFRSIFLAQLANPETQSRLWTSLHGGLIDWIRAAGGMPYVVLGDSHANHYSHRERDQDAWFAPLCIVCYRASAIGLGNAHSRLNFGPTILRWAESFAGHASGVPLFLKFGGIDSEFLWMLRRVRDGVRRFSPEEFAGFALRSITNYGRFIDALSAIIGPAGIRVCSVFPSVMADADWAEGFIRAHGGAPDEDQDLARRLNEFEVPGLLARTRLRAIYNTGLRGMCEAKGLTFVDDFSPLIGPDGTLDSRFFNRHGGIDHHLDHAASSEPVAAIIRASLAVEAGTDRPPVTGSR